MQRMEALLRLVKAMRDEEIVRGADANFLVAHPIMMIAEDRIDSGAGKNPALETISARMRKIERDGLEEDQEWPAGEVPVEYEELRGEWNRVADEIIAATFDEYGEPQLAAMYRHDQKRFNLLFESGRKTFFRG